MLMDFNFAEAEAYEPVPEGDYKVNCLNATNVTEGTKRPYIELELQIEQDSEGSTEQAGRTVNSRVYLPIEADRSEKTKDGRNKFGAMLSMVQEVADAFGVSTAKGLDTSKFAGKSSWATCNHELYEGRLMDRIGSFKPL